MEGREAVSGREVAVLRGAGRARARRPNWAVRRKVVDNMVGDGGGGWIGVFGVVWIRCLSRRYAYWRLTCL